MKEKLEKESYSLGVLQIAKLSTPIAKRKKIILNQKKRASSDTGVYGRVSNARDTQLHRLVHAEELLDDFEEGNMDATNEIVGLADRTVPTKVLCIWGSTCQLKDVKEQVRVALNGGVEYRLIEKIVRVVQRDHRVCYEIHTKTSDLQALRRRLLSRGGWRWGWSVRSYRPWRQRLEGQASRPASSTVTRISAAEMHTKWLRLATWNINGIKHKMEDIQHFVERYNIDVVAIQETQLRAHHFRLYMNGYYSVEVRGERTAEKRGIALLIKKGWTYRVVGRPHPNFLFIRLTGNNTNAACLVACAYFGKKSAQAKGEMLAEGRKLVASFPHDHMIVMGDFNQEKDRVKEYLNAIDSSFRLVKFHGSSTRCDGNKVIDHIAIAKRGGQQQLAANHDVTKMKARIASEYDTSDHWPVWTKVNVEKVPQQSNVDQQQTCKKRYRYHARELLLPIPSKSTEAESLKVRATCENIWSVLNDELESREWKRSENEEMNESSARRISEISAKVVDAIETTMTNLGVRREVKPPSKVQLNRKIKRAIDMRMKAYQKYRRLPNGSDKDEAKRKWKELRNNVRKMVCAFKNKRWLCRVLQAGYDKSQDPRGFWRWAEVTGGWKSKDGITGLCPVRDPDTNQLALNAKSISEAWGKHYKRLAADVTQHSRDEQYWQHMWRHKPDKEQLTTLNSEISMEELYKAVRALKYNKAPGGDGVPAEIYKIMMFRPRKNQQDDNDDNTEPVPFPPSAHMLLSLMNAMFQSASVPEIWKTSTVVSIPKKGDLTDMGNYRGISLMGVGLKILMRIISDRLNVEFEKHDLFSKGQAGFRTLEECATQIGCLAEVCQRRRWSNKDTYLTFVDLKKAYDTVPHGALLTKLHKAGVRGTMLDVIRSLYANSFIQVRSGEYPFNLSEPAQLLRGLRQGCPLSPILFNIFFDDVGEFGNEYGVKIPCAKNKWTSHIIGDLKFADDLVILTPSLDKTRLALYYLSEWTELNEMAVGISKCMTTVVSEDPTKMEELHCLDHPLMINDQHVPIGNEYVYLGVNFRNDVNLKSMMLERMTRMQKVAGAMKPFLRSKNIPTHLKCAVIQGVLLPTMLYGAELYGMDRRVTNKGQAILKSVMSWALCSKQTAKWDKYAFYREFGIAPLCAIATGRRARAYAKACQLSTWVNTLIQHPYRHRKWTWLSGTVRWMNRYAQKLAQSMYSKNIWPLNADHDYLVSKEGWKKISYSLTSPTTVSVVWAREDQVAEKCGRASKFYATYNLIETRLAKGSLIYDPRLVDGVNWLIRLRMQEKLWAPDLVQSNKLPTIYMIRCPMCKKNLKDGENVAHCLFECSKWDEFRNSSFRTLCSQVYALVGTQVATDDRAVALLLGGSITGRYIKDWLPKWKRRDDAVTEEQISDVVGQQSKGALVVAQYLYEVMHRRSVIITELRKHRARNAPAAATSLSSEEYDSATPIRRSARINGSLGIG